MLTNIALFTIYFCKFDSIYGNRYTIHVTVMENSVNNGLQQRIVSGPESSLTELICPTTDLAEKQLLRCREVDL